MNAPPGVKRRASHKPALLRHEGAATTGEAEGRGERGSCRGRHGERRKCVAPRRHVWFSGRPGAQLDSLGAVNTVVCPSL